MNFNLNILINSEDLALYNMIKKSPISSNSTISFCGPQEDILTFIQESKINLVITDIESDKNEKNNLLKEIKQFDPLVDVIFIADPSNSEEFLDFINLGAADYLTKPLEINTLVQSIQKIVNKKTLRKETFRLEKRLDKKYLFRGMVGKNPYMLDIFNLIDIISKNFTIVLITGETGTGKELVARALHEASPLKDKKFVVCNCSTIPENLFESELFGYVKGAFTGADKNKQGLFDEANGGIIFLDEIAEIPVFTQAKFLRVLEYHQFRPLGANTDRKVEVRVIVATNRNLRECLKNGTFREDLFHRLNKVEIELPPLRKRKEDIHLLVRYFLNQHQKKFSKKIGGVSRQVQKLFLQYHWPGNIRELENVLESSFIISQKDFIDIPDLPQYLQDVAPVVEELPFFSKEKPVSLEELEKNYIIYLLNITKNNLRKTAKILNISRTTLYHKLSKYDIPR